MTTRRLLSIFAPIVLTAACAEPPGPSDADRTWAGTILTEGNVTTVVNESGSVWGGTARLVEEASIGVDVGADVYMLGYLWSVAADDERIVLVDGQAVAVRTYDLAGQHLETLGAEGQGPGEYVGPRSSAIDGEGRFYVLDPRLGRINVYAADGAPFDTWSTPTPACCAWPMYPGDEGTLWLPVREVNRETGEQRYGVQRLSSTGPLGDVLWVPDIGFERITYSFNGRELDVPLGPRLAWDRLRAAAYSSVALTVIASRSMSGTGRF